jgi:tetratricopeptide (TPR) repeat protein
MSRLKEMMAQAEELYQEGNTNQAAEAYTEIAALAGWLGLPAPHAVCLRNAASIYEATGDINRALPLYEQALVVQDSARAGRRDPSYAHALSHLARLYAQQEQPTKAEALYLQAVAATKGGLLHKASPDHVLYLVELAEFYVSTGTHTKGEPLLREAALLAAGAAGLEPATHAKLLYRLATLYQQIGHPAQAEPLYRQALELQEKTLPKDHPDIMATMLRLITVYDQTNQPLRALPLHQRLLVESLWHSDLDTIMATLNKVNLDDTSQHKKSLVAHMLNDIGVRVVNEAQKQLATYPEGSPEVIPEVIEELGRGLTILGKAAELGSFEAKDNHSRATAIVHDLADKIINQALLFLLDDLPEIKNLVAQAKEAEQRENYDEAVRLYERALDGAPEPKSALVCRQLAQCLHTRALASLRAATQKLVAVRDEHRQRMDQETKAFMTTKLRGKGLIPADGRCAKCKESARFKFTVAAYGDIHVCERHQAELGTILNSTPNYDFMSPVLRTAEADLIRASGLAPNWEEPSKDLADVQKAKKQFPMYGATIAAPD